MLCWYCYWGWSKPVREIYEKFITIAGEAAMDYGPAHIVWGDENFERSHVQWCLDQFEQYRGDHGDAELAAVRTSLEELLRLPDEVLAPEPADYDGEHPKRYPPAVEMTH